MCKRGIRQIVRLDGGYFRAEPLGIGVASSLRELVSAHPASGFRDSCVNLVVPRITPLLGSWVLRASGGAEVAVENFV